MKNGYKEKDSPFENVNSLHEARELRTGLRLGQ